jgi:cholesterol transport system auxiliary component
MNTSYGHNDRRGPTLSLASLLSASLLVSACALSGRVPAPPVATYVLEGTGAAPAIDPPQSNLVLKVSMPVAAPAFASSRIAYIEQPYRIDYFARNEWVDPPARMLRPLLMRQLTNCGLFRFVFADSAGIDETIRLDSEITELVQTFSESSSEVRLSLHFDLVDVAHRAILVSRTIAVTEPAARDPYAGVVAANRAVQRALDQLVTLLHDPVIALGKD